MSATKAGRSTLSSYWFSPTPTCLQRFLHSLKLKAQATTLKSRKEMKFKRQKNEC